MAWAFAKVYAECEQLIGSHTHNFKTVQQSGIMRQIPTQMQQAIKNGLQALQTNENMLKNCSSAIQQKIKYMDKDFDLLNNVALKSEMSKHHLGVLESELQVTLRKKNIRPAPVTRSPAVQDIKRTDFIGSSPKLQPSQSIQGLPKHQPHVDSLRNDLINHQISSNLSRLDGSGRGIEINQSQTRIPGYNAGLPIEPPQQPKNNYSNVSSPMHDK